MAVDYRQVAVAAARKYGVDPGVFQRQIQQESGWNPNARSPAGAVGIAQFMPATARGMGVNPADPIQALDGAARLMAQHLRAYKGDYASALAAYNAGPGNVSRWRSIPETRNYVARILGPGGQGAPQGPPVAPPTAGGTAPPQAPSPGGGALNLPRLLALLRADQKDLQAGRLPDRFREIEKAIGPIPSPAAPNLDSAAGIPSQAPGPGQQIGAAVSSTGGLFGGKHYRVIGTPHAGTHTIGNWQSDNAIDVAAPYGSPVYAAFDGRIGQRFGSLGSSNPRMAGLRLNLEAPTNAAYYAHLSRFAPGIQPGRYVTRGSLLGYTGAANGVEHLHWGVEHGDPRSYYR